VHISRDNNRHHIYEKGESYVVPSISTRMFRCKCQNRNNIPSENYFIATKIAAPVVIVTTWYALQLSVPHLISLSRHELLVHAIVRCLLVLVRLPPSVLLLLLLLLRRSRCRAAATGSRGCGCRTGSTLVRPVLVSMALAEKGVESLPIRVGVVDVVTAAGILGRRRAFLRGVGVVDVSRRPGSGGRESEPIRYGAHQVRM